jgi:flagellar biosynthesis protein FliQ
MDISLVLEMNRDLFFTALLVALPVLAISLIVGIFTSIFQTVTSLQDQTIGYVPKILLIGLVVVVTMGFSLEQAIAFAHRMFEHAAGVGR